MGAFALSYTEGRQWDEDGAGARARAAQRAAGLDIALEELLPAQGVLPGLAMRLGWRRIDEGGLTANDLGTAFGVACRFRNDDPGLYSPLNVASPTF